MTSLLPADFTQPSLQIFLRINLDGTGFNHQFFEFRRISFVWYSFWHSKAPHLFDSISYCLTNGVLFTFMRVFIGKH